jgi:hypothetical protein
VVLAFWGAEAETHGSSAARAAGEVASEMRESQRPGRVA